MDIIMNFLALVIISEFDDFFFMTVQKANPMGKLIREGEITLSGGETRSLEELLTT